MEKYAQLGSAMPPAFRLGFATRGNTHPAADDVLFALDRGINYWNWCGYEDGMSQAVRELGQRRSEVIVAMQIGIAGKSHVGVVRELEQALVSLQTDWLDVVTLYYVESDSEWEQLTRAEGAMQALQDAKREGLVRSIGLTSHQRPLVAKWAESDLLDMLMIRYNAAHRGAETEVFPIAQRFQLPVVCFTCLRWGALAQSTANDPVGFNVPQAPEWYRYVLSNPRVSVALMAPDNRQELVENLALLDDWREVSESARFEMEAHGDRVRKVAGPFP